VIERVVGEPQAFDLEHRLLMPGGRVKHLQMMAQVRELEPGRSHFMGAVTDITQRKCAEDALRQSEQRYRHLFHHMPIALWQIDSRRLIDVFKEPQAAGVTDLGDYINAHPDFLDRAMGALIIAEVNEGAVRMFEARDANELSGPITRFLRNSRDMVRRAVESRYRGETAFEEDTKLLTVDGRTLNVHFSTASLDPTTGSGITIVGLVNISERVRAQENLQRLQAEFAHAQRVSMLGELTASIAHEISQPLSAIRTSAETTLRWLDRPEPNIGEVRALASTAIADAQRAADIIARIRKMARGQTNERGLLSLEEVIREALVFLNTEIKAQRTAVSLDLTPGLPQLFGDRTQLQQVVVNLTVNALQAMSATNRRALIIRAGMQMSGFLVGSVEDSGPGLNAADIDRVFDSFFSSKESGMGMGLSISRAIVETHGGRIMADNNSELGGARFRFTLPVVGQILQ
jgi:C4-dicarboxylate-specific signal transduction histidine kinase